MRIVNTVIWRSVLTGLLLSATLGSSASGGEPLQALLVTGGCCHDYDNQKNILSQGISARAHVEWTIVQEGGTSSHHKVSIYEDPDWAKDYDVVVHNECFSGVKDEAFIKNITGAHYQGTPGVVIHCAMHSYRDIQSDMWRQCLGVTSRRHQSHQPFKVENLKTDHPVMARFPESWQTPQGELYEIIKLWPNTTPLAQAYGKDSGKYHVCIWANQYGEGRIFGTTIGHHNETMETEVYLDMITRGLLWACDKLDPQGNPKPGYGVQASK